MSAGCHEDGCTSTADAAAAFERAHADEVVDGPTWDEAVDADGWSPGWPYIEPRPWNVGLGWST